jgi:hypothetical protein
MTDVDVLLARFIEEWNAGRRPAVEDFLSHASELERDDLADQISTFLAFAPTPRFDEKTIDELLSASTVKASAQAFAADAGVWPTLLPRLRLQAGLSLRDLASRVLSATGLSDRGLDKTERRLGEMERGELDATKVSTRIVDALGHVLGMNPTDLARAGIPAAAAGALYRREEGYAVADGLDLLAEALTAPIPEGEWDEVDELFFGRDR